MSVVDDIRARLDIVDYVQRFVTLKKAGRHYKACCPFHSERTPSFTVNPDTQSWRCFGACAEGGDVFSFAMKQNGWTFAEALRELGKLVGVEVEKQTPQQKERSEHLDKLRGLLSALADEYHHYLLDGRDANAQAALHYAREKRGFTDETLRRFKIGYAPPGWSNALDFLKGLGYSENDIVEAGAASRSEEGRVYDRFRNRLIIPIRDDRGRVVGFGARALAADDNPKYLNSPQSPVFDKSRLLFGLDSAKRAIRDSRTAVIVEGYMDAIQAHQAGFTNVVAQMGTAMTEPQLKLLSPTLADKIILALDADAAGQSATKRSLEVARQTLQADYRGKLAVDIRILQIPDAKDPDDLLRETPQIWQTLVSDALPVSDFLIRSEMDELPRNASIEEREALARRLLPLLTATENDLHKQDNLQKLAIRLHIAEKDLLRLVPALPRKPVERDSRKSSVERRVPPAPVIEPPLDVSAIPDFPPTDYEGVEPPPAWADEADELAPLKILPAAPARSIDTVANRYAAPLEAYCLRILLGNPDLVFAVNRKFREIASEKPLLMQGPLNALCEDDFSRSTYRALMGAFNAAFQQHDLALMDYLRAHLEGVLIQEMELLLQDEIDTLRPRLRHGLAADLEISLRENRQLSLVDPSEELIARALRLRLERLKRQIADLHFLRMGDDDIATDIFRQVALAAEAQGRIEQALKHYSR
jgi:DNA primase